MFPAMVFIFVCFTINQNEAAEDNKPVIPACLEKGVIL